ncbi:hypothetical protein J3R30DRAFT_3655330 [Lentinula aciculospora]|uniref:Glutamine amidotransferase domain-containing protein n=1 Tax=Lentinula aciculospora TaxID=153920 RepID=A0A9W9AM09_9AGAR|nr:hypothetical protein J3R30DRAFT_3655330 [Lentinula aciculospora]
MGLFLLDYGAGNVQSLANSLSKLGHTFEWILSPADFHKATAIGAFETAVENLKKKGLLEPLKEYVQSGKPYFGICIGMQVLFQSSEESPNFYGLGIVPTTIDLFDNLDKTVPHMGWNSADLVQTQDVEPAFYYFVHSYCAKYSPTDRPDAASWAYTTTQYGGEIFISSVRKGNVFGTQFHPEKSGAAGLALIDNWLRTSEVERSAAISKPETFRTPPTLSLRLKDNLSKRIIACMDVRSDDDGNMVVTKGDQYDVREKVPSGSSMQIKIGGAVRNLGKPVTLASKYYAAGADEICLLNITSFRHSPLQDQPMLAVVRAAAECVFVPLTIGGGIKDTVDPDGTKRSALEVASAYFRAGADKVSIGSDAVYAAEKLLASGQTHGDGTSSIETIAHAYGRQAVVVSVDPRRVYVDTATYDGPHQDELVHGSPESALESDRGRTWWYACTVSGGRETRSISVCQLACAVEALGAGEILVNSIDRDGTGLGFDAGLLRLVKGCVKVPVVASSGAGSKEHFVEVFEQTGVEAALAAGIFHRGEVDIGEVKECLTRNNVKVRTHVA